VKKSLFTVFLLSLIVILAACGSSDNGSDEDNDSSETESPSAGSDLSITASNFEFDENEYTVQSGEEVKVNLTNEEGNHGIAIDEFDLDIQGDGEASFTPDEPGEYEIYCSVPCGEGHDEMKSTLIVE